MSDEKTQDELPPTPRNYPLFELMSREHGLTLLESELDDIERVVMKMQNLPANWHEDSSLETWFPFTAEELVKNRERIARLEKELEMAKASKAWKFVTVMCAEGAKATTMSNYELCKAIAEEITDKIPMNSREFSLIDELVNRMDGKLKDYFVPLEWYDGLIKKVRDALASRITVSELAEYVSGLTKPTDVTCRND